MAVGKTAIESVLDRTDVWLMVFGIIVVVGVAGESVFGIIHWIHSRRLQGIQHTEERQREEVIARLRNDSERARAEAEAFKAQIAKANESAA